MAEQALVDHQKNVQSDLPVKNVFEVMVHLFHSHLLCLAFLDFANSHGTYESHDKDEHELHADREVHLELGCIDL